MPPSKVILVILTLALIPSLAHSLSVVLDKDANGEILKVRVLGTFVPQPQILFYDQVDVAYEKGTKNPIGSSYPTDRVLTFDDTRHNSNALWDNVINVAIGDSDTSKRHKKSERYYYGQGKQIFLGDTKIYPRSLLGAESKKVYLSWWFKQKYDTKTYFTFLLSNVSSDFTPKEGELITVDAGEHWSGITKIYGKVIDYDIVTKKLIANFDEQSNANRLTGNTVSLDENLATATLATYFPEESIGANKFIRVWEGDGSADMFRLSWTNTHISQGDLNETIYSPIPTNQWAHLEAFINQSSKKIDLYINSKLHFSGMYSEASDMAGHSATLGLIGFDGSRDVQQGIHMDDIYFDTKFTRITLANAAKHSEITQEEIQRYSSWTDSEIEFTPYYGSILESRENVYVYIYNEDGVINSDGIILLHRIQME